MRVVNMKNEKCDVRCDRGSMLGNKYIIGKDGDREEVIRKYRQWLWVMMNKNEKILNELKRLVELDKKINGKLKLGCWCVPKNCHTFVIIRACNWLKENGKEKR